MDLKESSILRDGIANHWYYRSKALATVQLLMSCPPIKILDVGAGSAFFSRYILAHSDALEAWCVDSGYLENSTENVHGKTIHYRRSIDCVDVDTVLLMDVLEHVEDDVGLLADYAAKVPRDSRFLITVPAFQCLWSGHDVFLDHKRRYTLSQLENVVQRAGLIPRHSAYYFGFIFPLASALRLGHRVRSCGEIPKSHLKNHAPIVNSFLAAACRAELPLLSVNRLAGLTVFCLAERQ